MPRNLASWLLLGGVLVADAALGAENWATVREAELRSLFAGAELGDGVHYSYRFGPDGTFSGTEMGKGARGTWRVASGELCLKWIQPPEAEQCHVVQRDGSAIRLLIFGSEARLGTLRR